METDEIYLRNTQNRIAAEKLKALWDNEKKPEFSLIGDGIELFDIGTVSLFERHYFEGKEKIIEYYSLDEKGNKRYFKATKDPEKLTDEERHRVLNYTLSNYSPEEVVNYLDLFLQFEFIEEVNSL